MREGCQGNRPRSFSPRHSGRHPSSSLRGGQRLQYQARLPNARRPGDHNPVPAIRRQAALAKSQLLLPANQRPCRRRRCQCGSNRANGRHAQQLWARAWPGSTRGGRSRMEPLWSPVVATGRNRSQMLSLVMPVRQAKTVAVGCDHLPIDVDGKEGVDGSSPSKGSAKAPEIGAFSFASTCKFSNVAQVWSPLWSLQVEEAVCA